MADPRGLYTGPQEQGWATILPRSTRGSFFDYVSAAGATKAKRAQLERKKRDDALKGLKPEETWRHFQPALQEEFTQLFELAKDPNHDPVELQQKFSDYVVSAQTGMQLKDEFEGVRANYDRNKKVNADVAYSELLNRYVKDGSTRQLKEIATKGINDEFFLEEDGGSAFINSDEATRDVLDNAFKEHIETLVTDISEGKITAPGLKEFATNYDRQIVKGFEDVVGGRVVIADEKELINRGVLDVFRGNAYTNRLVEDGAKLLAQKDGNAVDDMYRAEALREILKPYKSGKVETKEDIKGLRYFEEGRGARDLDAFADRLVKKMEALGRGEGYVEERPQLGFLGREGAPVPSGRTEKRDPIFKGEKIGNITFGDVEFVNGEPYINFTEQTIDEDGDKVFNKRQEPLNMDVIRRALPVSVARRFEAVARQRGLIDEEGNFKFEGQQGPFIPGQSNQQAFIPGQ